MAYRPPRRSSGFPADCFSDNVPLDDPCSASSGQNPMSDSTETASRRVRDSQETVDLVCDRVSVAVLPAEADLALAFARVFLARAPEDLLRRRSEDDLVGMTLGAFRFLMASRPTRVDVSVTNQASADEGWEPVGTVVRTNVSERPFIIDTIREFLHAQELAVEWMVYPILDVDRDAAGEVVAVRPPSDTGSKESVVHCE